MSGTMRRKIGIRTWPTAAVAATATATAAAEETPALPPLPAAKKPRLQAPSRITITSAAIREEGVEHYVHTSTAERVTTDSPPHDDTPTVPPVTQTPPATSLPSAGGASHEEDDTKLIEAVKRHGKAWVAVAALVPGRTNRQCRQRWSRSLDPDIGKIAGKWIPEEDDTKLIEAVKRHGKAWVAVAALVPGRTNRQCRQRWSQSLDPDIGKIAGKWIPEEDTKLIEAVKRHGKAWVAVAALVPGRTNEQCNKRWTQTLDPDIGKKAVQWAPEEDTKLAEAVKRHGTDWVAVAALVHGRPNRQCRRRWTLILDPAIRKKAGKWTPEEDTKLIEAVKKHGTSWVAVAALVPGRTNRQCNRRWSDRLDPNRASNTVEEDPDCRQSRRT
jgi:lysophospholipase L1-like esterase